MATKELSEEERKLAKGYAEGNKFLERTLIACWENGIKTHACCGGHKEIYDGPYLAIIIDNESLPYIKKIIGQLQSFQNISMTSNIRSGVGVLPDEGRSFSIHGLISNRCEMFSKILKGITSENELTLTYDAQRILRNIEYLNNTDYSELLRLTEQEGIIVGSTLSTASKELIEYRGMKMWSIFDKLLAKLLPRKKTRI